MVLPTFGPAAEDSGCTILVPAVMKLVVVRRARMLLVRGVGVTPVSQAQP